MNDFQTEILLGYLLCVVFFLIGYTVLTRAKCGKKWITDINLYQKRKFVSKICFEKSVGK